MKQIYSLKKLYMYIFIYIFLIYFSSQKDYLCFHFVPRHHNIIRYRRGIAVIKDDFHTVCSWVQFKNQVAWKYDLYLGESTFLWFSLLIIFKENVHIKNIF